MPTPEALARQPIDALLASCGWVVQDRADLNLYANRGDAPCRGVAGREFPVEGGFADYRLFVDRKACGVIEAKAEGHTLSQVADQAGPYTVSLPASVPHVALPLPFQSESAGVETLFRDNRDPSLRRSPAPIHPPPSLRHPPVEPPRQGRE